MKSRKTLENVIVYSLIGVMLLAIVLNLVMTELMNLNVIPDDWYFFHDYLHRTGVFRVYIYLLTFLAVAVVVLIQRKFKLLTPVAARNVTFWILAVSTLDALGNMFGWFAINASFGIEWYDDIVHIFGGFAMASISWVILQNILNNRKDKLLVGYAIAIVFFAAVTIGTFYGVYEYYSDLLRHTSMVGGAKDAITDNVFDTIGGVIAALLLVLQYKTGWNLKTFYSQLTSVS